MKKRIVYFILATVICGSMLLTACRKDGAKPADNQSVTEIPTVSEEVTPTIEPTVEASPSVTLTPTKGEEISQAQAVQKVQRELGERGYNVNVINENLNMDGKDYYVLQISSSIEAFEPNVIINKETGEMLCFYSDGTTTSFMEHPLFARTENGNEKVEFTKEEALKKLESLPKDSLGLRQELSNYTIVYDDWTTMAGGETCYGINVYSGTGADSVYAGTFYVGVDGDGVYVFDYALDDFKVIE